MAIKLLFPVPRHYPWKKKSRKATNNLIKTKYNKTLHYTKALLSATYNFFNFSTNYTEIMVHLNIKNLHYFFHFGYKQVQKECWYLQHTLRLDEIKKELLHMKWSQKFGHLPVE